MVSERKDLGAARSLTWKMREGENKASREQEQRIFGVTRGRGKETKSMKRKERGLSEEGVEGGLFCH